MTIGLGKRAKMKTMRSRLEYVVSAYAQYTTSFGLFILRTMECDLVFGFGYGKHGRLFGILYHYRRVANKTETSKAKATLMRKYMIYTAILQWKWIHEKEGVCLLICAMYMMF